MSITRGPLTSRSPDHTALYHEIHSAPGEARAVVLVVHGFGEHSGRYAWMAEQMNQAGRDVILFDYRGHGRAAGQRGHVGRFTEYLADFDTALEVASAESARRGGKPIAILGHSHGALIALRAVLDATRERPADLRSLVLSSPFLGISMPVPAWKDTAGRAMAKLIPRLSMPSGIPASSVSRDPDTVAAYAADPLNHAKASARWYVEAQAAQAWVKAHAGDLALPALLVVGGDDRIASAPATRAVAALMPKDRAELRLIEGAYHEVLNEQDRASKVAEVLGWLDKQGS